MNLNSPKNPARGTWLIRSAITAFTSLLIGFVVSSVARPDRWLVERVAFEGAQRARIAELRHLADLRNGTLVWSVEPLAIATAVERHPWVRSAAVRVIWPDTVHVQIEEHEVAALLHDHDRLLYIGHDGIAFLVAQPDDLDYPHITGIGRELDALHPQLGNLAVRDALHLIDHLDREGLVAREDLSEIAFSTSLGFTVHTDGARIVFGHGGLQRQIDRLSALAAGGLDLKSRTYIDLAPTTVAIVRPLEIPAGG